MTVFLSVLSDVVIIQQRAADDTGRRGDVIREIYPDGVFVGWTYSELRAMGSGAHEIEPKPLP